MLRTKLGCGISGGGEAIVHEARKYLTSCSDEKILLKLEFANAFNSIHRDQIIAAVANFAPVLYKYVVSSYCLKSFLKFGEFQLLSSQGVQQGDPLGPLLFCLTIQPLLSKLQSDFVAAYLDDVVIGGLPQRVRQDVNYIESQSDILGLSLNKRKCEIIGHSSDSCLNIQRSYCDFTIVEPSQAFLLGAPLAEEGVVTSLDIRTQWLVNMKTRLEFLYSHAGFVLLRYSFLMPRLLYLLRCAPCFNAPNLNDFDVLQREILCMVLNITINDNQWTQVSLPVRYGGLGIRSAVEVAPSAFLSSLIKNETLINCLLNRSECNDITSSINSAYHAWANGLLEDICINLHQCASSSFHSLDAYKIRASAHRLSESSTSPSDQARLKASSSKAAGAWLNALPLASLGLKMDDNTFRVACGLRLGANICLPHTCRCGAQVGMDGVHRLSCRFSAGRHIRHTMLNDIIQKALSAARIPATLEPGGLARSDGKRPDGLTLVPWKSGRHMIWDVTVVDTFAPSYVDSTAVSPGRAAVQAECRKSSKYAELMSDYHFVPVGFETTGAYGRSAWLFVQDVGRRIAAANSDPKALPKLRQRLSVAIQKGNAISICGTNNGDSDF